MASSPPEQTRTSGTGQRLGLVAILVFAIAIHFWGIRKDLPWAYESDEARFHILGVTIASTGDLNPRWFGHPGSTFIYPLAASLHLYDVWRGAELGVATPELSERFARDRTPYFLVGRVLAVGYAILTLPVIFAIGNLAFGPPAGLVATWLALMSTQALDHAQMVRTDSAGLFFGFLAIWAVLRVRERNDWRRQLFAGVAIGLAIGTRYFLGIAGILLLAVDALHLRSSEKPPWGLALLGIVTAVIAFGLSSPYFLIDPATVLENLSHEARQTHLGADGLSYFGNLGWYFGTAIPRAVPITLLAPALVGVLLTLAQPRCPPMLLLAFGLIFLLSISAAALHWQRWLLQIFPLFALFAAGGIVTVTRRLPLGDGARWASIAVVVIVVSAFPAWTLVRFSAAQARPGTRLLAREWVLQNIRPDDRMAAEFYTGPVNEPLYPIEYRFSLGENPDLNAYVAEGYDYVMISSAVYGRYLREPGRYPKEVAFYRSIFRRPKVAEFAPGRDGRGPIIAIHRIGRGSRPAS